MRRSENEGGNTKKTFFIMYNFHKMYTHYENWKLDPAMAATKYEKYEKHLLPLEKISLFNELVDPPYSEADVLAKPIILIAGQYSTGKTTFIRYLLEQDFPGIRIGPEPTTDRLVLLQLFQYE